MLGSGLLLIVLGFLLVTRHGSKGDQCINAADHWGVAMFISGAAMALGGLVLWLWKVAP